ncbi:MAG: chromosomal replication initiator protein DnaA [Planctomycetota bacterium]|nr:chromosomal replication initiator protein DnaA [Planctomycetota bacterium]
MGETAQRSDAGKPGTVESVAPAQAAEGAALESEADKAWQKILAALRETVQAEQYETWFRRSAVVRCDDKDLVLAVQNSFSRDWMRNYYVPALESAARSALGGPRRVLIEVDPERVLAAAPPPAAEVAATAPPSPNGGLGRAAPTAPGPRRIGALGTDRLVQGSDIGLNPKYTFDNFVVGPCNRFAHAAAMGTAESPGKAYNPLFLHGNVGLGKTHLLQSTCHAMLETWEDLRILFLSCETFVNHFIGALENGDIQKFRNKYRNVDVLVVDDIHLLANKERTQEEFFHTFNTLYNAGKQIILSSDSPPKEIPTLQERLVSRFKWGLVTEMVTPCYETRMAILKRKSRARGQELPDDVARLLAERIDTNIRELEGATTKLLGYASLSGEPITPELAREALDDVFTVRRGEPTMEEILSVITAHYNVKVTDLQSRKRTNAVAYPRQIAMFLARSITRHSLEEIGGYFGGRDHSTVLYAVEKIKRLCAEDERCREVVGGLLDDLRAPSR